MSKRRKERASIGDYLVYAVYRSVSFLLSLLPVTWVFRGGQAVGFLGYVLLFPYRQLARRNVRIAFPDWSSRQIERCVRTHFQNLVCRLLLEKKKLVLYLSLSLFSRRIASKSQPLSYTTRDLSKILC